MSDVVQELRDQIDAKKIIFDAPEDKAARLKQELLGENRGTKVTTKLQTLVLEISKIASPHVRVSSVVREGDDGHHGIGRAFDMGNEEIAGTILPQVATDEMVAKLDIDDLIFDASVAEEADRNKWNYNAGEKHNFSDGTLRGHKNHIHFSVKS